MGDDAPRGNEAWNLHIRPMYACQTGLGQAAAAALEKVMKVSIRVFDKDEQTFLATLIGQAAKRLSLDLTYTDASSAEVVFVKEDEPGASLFAHACTQRSGPIAVVYGGQGYSWCLERPASTRSLIGLLPLLCAKLPASDALGELEADGRTGSAASPRGLLPVKRGQDFLEQVGELTANAAAWRARFGGDLQLFADRARGLVYLPESYSWRIRDLFRLALASERPHLCPLATAELDGITAGMHSMPLEGFLWLVAQEAEPEPPGNICSAILQRKFKLQRWPSFSRFEHDSLHIVLSGQLMKQPSTLQELCSRSDWSPREVLKFYNSACMCDLLQLEKATTVAALGTGPITPGITAREEKAGVFSRILRHFAG